jgi:hypothetical protein
VGWSCDGGPGPGGGGAKSEYGKAGHVGGGGEEVEVGVDLGGASYSGSSTSVPSAHEVSEFAFDLGTGAPIVGEPVRIGLLLAGLGQGLFVGVDSDGASPGRFGALGARGQVAQWTVKYAVPPP